MKYSVIIPTLGDREEELERLLDSLLEQGSVGLEIIIALQDSDSKYIKSVIKKYKQLNIMLLELEKRGLSYARNKAIQHVTGDVLVFADDDCWYPPNKFIEIQTLVEENDVTTFKIYDPNTNRYFKENYLRESKVLSKYELFKVSSIEIFINLKRVKIEDIIFDERFGVGAQYELGEENTLLLDLYKKGYKAKFINDIVTFHRVMKPRIDKKGIYEKSIFFKRNFSTLEACCLICLFLVKKRQLNLTNISQVYRGFQNFGKG
ncbi:glycosyltransferase family 2 protein [Bacillus paramobilis]|uniref:glycosyltransferase family 2 protein n=1 Tax=Bacillus paramobilis TaxID=2817477 RepID=UPI003217EF2A